jgi:4-hydroxythreonine-4-phosphate dehydrogenase
MIACRPGNERGAALIVKKYAHTTPQTLARVTEPTVCVVTELAEKNRVPGKPVRA